VVKQVMTVRGAISPDELGHTQMHDHLFADLSWARHRWLAMPITDEVQITEEIRLYGQAGGGTLVDPVLEHIGRLPEAMRRVSEATGVHVVMGTGFYREPYYPEFVNKLPTQDIADYIVDEIENGVGDTGIKPGIIGEIGLDKRWVQGVEERVLRAAARAQVATGLAITTHTPPKMSLEFLKIFQEEGVEPDRVVFGHLDNTLEMHELERVAATGAYIEFDLIGIDFINSDKRRAEFLAELVRLGHQDRLLVSQDMCSRSRFKTNGGHGYQHLIDNFLPMLREEGVDEEAIQAMTHLNPARVLAV
jgi:phosphotriesterase-related protein